MTHDRRNYPAPRLLIVVHRVLGTWQTPDRYLVPVEPGSAPLKVSPWIEKILMEWAAKPGVATSTYP